jgi:SAM-dependent methyltransferase
MNRAALRTRVAAQSVERDDVPRRLTDALSGSGAIGATVRQLAAQLGYPTGTVSDGLTELAERGATLRIGRGLWVLREFERLRAGASFHDPAEYVERFQTENGVALATYAGPITFGDSDGLRVHRWWPYVQGYSSQFVRELLARSDLAKGARVLDPFSGSGTTVVEARLAGFEGLGLELLAPAVLAARVKTHFELAPKLLRERAARFVAAARRRTGGDLPFLRETRQQFAPGALAELRKMRASLPDERTAADRAVRLAFGRILVPVSRLRRSPCLGYARSAQPTSPTPSAAFAEAIRDQEEDLAWLAGRRARWGPPARILAGDARAQPLPRDSVQLAVTSPPYVNGMDYVMNYKLDLAWLGYVDSYRELSDLRRTMVACDNLPRGAADPYLSVAAAPDPWLPEILRQIQANVEAKGSYRRQDVHGIVHRYFADLVPVLRHVHAALVPGGRFVLVVGDSLMAGVYIPGDLLLARIGASLGFVIDSVEVARSRRSGQRRSFELRETVITLRKPRSAS